MAFSTASSNSLVLLISFAALSLAPLIDSATLSFTMSCPSIGTGSVLLDSPTVSSSGATSFVCAWSFPPYLSSGDLSNSASFSLSYEDLLNHGFSAYDSIVSGTLACRDLQTLASIASDVVVVSLTTSCLNATVSVSPSTVTLSCTSPGVGSVTLVAKVNPAIIALSSRTWRFTSPDASTSHSYPGPSSHKITLTYSQLISNFPSPQSPISSLSGSYTGRRLDIGSTVTSNSFTLNIDQSCSGITVSTTPMFNLPCSTPGVGSVTLDASISNPLDLSLSSKTWTFTSTDSSTSHSYPDSGSNQITINYAQLITDFASPQSPISSLSGSFSATWGVPGSTVLSNTFTLNIDQSCSTVIASSVSPVFNLSCSTPGVGSVTLDANISNPAAISLSINWSLNGITYSPSVPGSAQLMLTYAQLTSHGLSPSATSMAGTFSGRRNDSSEYFATANFQLGIDGACHSIVSGDPHFVGAHGTHFDFNGELGHSYCLVSDQGIHINGRLKGYTSDATVGATMNKDGKGTRSWLGELGLIWTDPSTGNRHTLHLVTRNGIGNRRQDGFLTRALYDGQVIDITSSPAVLLSTGGMTLRYLGTVRRSLFDVDQLRFQIHGLLDLIIGVLPASPKFQLANDSQVHFDLSQKFFQPSPKVHGILGQTYQRNPARMTRAAKYLLIGRLIGEAVKADGATGYGFLDGKLSDYEVSDILEPDCNMSAFTSLFTATPQL